MGQAFGLEYECGQGPYRTLLLILFLCEENPFKVTTILAHIMLPYNKGHITGVVTLGTDSYFPPEIFSRFRHGCTKGCQSRCVPYVLSKTLRYS